ncbi:MAG: hypothetical protein GY798_25965 [Hyphomicrobiales bacterium]|nr:hypothetical protein [Hyphomicrobiales bacterium]
MTKLSRRSLLAGVGGGVLGLSLSPLGAQDTDKRPAEGGIGGTGIVGTLMDFGSLIVNGLRVETDAQTAYSSTVGAFDPAQLAVGQSLTIEATGSEKGLLPRRVHVTYPLVGRVEFTDEVGSRLRVAGIDVIADIGTVTEIQPGARVLVSGIWRGESVVAGLIDPAPDPRASRRSPGPSRARVQAVRSPSAGVRSSSRAACPGRSPTVSSRPPVAPRPTASLPIR